MSALRRFSYALSSLLLAAFCGCAGAASPPGQTTANQLAAARAGSSVLTSGTFPVGAIHGKTSAELGLVQPTAHGWISPSAKNAKLLYLSSLGTNSIGIYSQKGANQSPMGTITDGLNFPCCMTVDDAGNLYVTNEGANNVSVYPPGQTSPSTVYTTDLSTACDVAVAHDGTIYISNFNGIVNGWVAVYPQGDTSKEYRLSDFGGGAPLALALDAKENLFVMYDLNGNGSSAVNEYAPGATVGTNLNLNFKFGAGIAIDKHDDVVVVQQVQPSEILVFPPGTTQPSQTITEPGGDQSFAIALDKHGNTLFAADDDENVVYDFTYPAGVLRYSVAGGFDNPSGIAVSPPQTQR